MTQSQHEVERTVDLDSVRFQKPGNHSPTWPLQPKKPWEITSMPPSSVSSKQVQGFFLLHRELTDTQSTLVTQTPFFEVPLCTRHHAGIQDTTTGDTMPVVYKRASEISKDCSMDPKMGDASQLCSFQSLGDSNNQHPNISIQDVVYIFGDDKSQVDGITLKDYVRGLCSKGDPLR